MQVRPDSQTIEPEDLGTRVMEATGLLVGRHPELLDSVEAGIIVPIIEISQRVGLEMGFGVPLGNFRNQGLATMVYRAATDDYKELAKHMAWVSVLSKRLAHYLSEINALHPFREGNGVCNGYSSPNLVNRPASKISRYYSLITKRGLS